MEVADKFKKLNAAQRAAACHGAGPLLILAGAGTGKTNTLAHRLAPLMLECANPQRILLLTFSRRAAIEMTRRAQRIVGELAMQVRLPWSGTFHSIANRLIRRHCTRIGLQPNFSVLDRGDAADLLDLVRHELGFSKSERRFPRKDTNALQAEILRRLRPDGKGLTVVGDDAQAIYSFRAATVENIRSFASRFGAATIDLEENYRSTQPILDAANALIGKRLRSIKGTGKKPRYVTVADDAAQANY